MVVTATEFKVNFLDFGIMLLSPEELLAPFPLDKETQEAK